jgi:hypothetical protein
MQAMNDRRPGDDTKIYVVPPPKPFQFRLRTALILMIIVPPVLFYISVVLGIGGNVGAEVGYYGQFNRVKHVLQAMPNVEIVSDWKHHDLTLEDFGFVVLVNGSQRVHVMFHEGTPEMNETDKVRLRQIIELAIAKDNVTRLLLTPPPPPPARSSTNYTVRST